MVDEAANRQPVPAKRMLGVLHRLLSVTAGDPLLWAARAAVVVGSGALLFAATTFLHQPSRDTHESWQPGRTDDPVGRSLGSADTAAGSGGAAPGEAEATAYERWDAPDSRRLLMIPAAGQDGRVWTGEMDGQALTVHAAVGAQPLTLPLPPAIGAHTMGVAIDDANTVWLAQDGAHAIGRYDPETRRYTEYQTPTQNSSPFGIATDATGRVWFTEVAARRIGVLDPDTETITEYPLPDGAGNPYWLAVAPDGRIWFTTLTAPSVGVLEPGSGALQMIPIRSLHEHDGTTGIDIAADGSVWFGTREGMLGRVDPATISVETHQTPGTRIYGVVADRNGRVWAASTRDAVYAFEPKAGQFCSVETGDGAWWLTDAPDGSIWVAESVPGASGLGRIGPEQVAAPCVGVAG